MAAAVAAVSVHAADARKKKEEPPPVQQAPAQPARPVITTRTHTSVDLDWDPVRARNLREVRRTDWAHAVHPRQCLWSG